jgi:RHS repeat-associated protein
VVFTHYTDEAGGPRAVLDPQGAWFSTTHNRNGDVSWVVNRMGQSIGFWYDSLSRPTKRVVSGSDIANFAYDTASGPTAVHWTSASNAEATDTTIIDGAGFPRTVKRTFGSGLKIELTMAYDGADRSKLVLAKPGAWRDSLMFIRDSLRYPTSLPDFAGQRGTLRYTSAGQMDQLTYPIGSPSGSGFKLNLSGLTGPNKSQFIDGVQYMHDGLGRLETQMIGSSASGTERRFSYDARGRLSGYTDYSHWTEMVYSSCAGFSDCENNDPLYAIVHDAVTGARSYAPDASGNRTDGSPTFNMVGGLPKDRLLSMTGVDGVTYAFSYDAEGRRLSKVKTSSGTAWAQYYTWNGLSELTSVQTVNGSTSTTVTYGYDAGGHRVRKTVGGVTTYYVWDGDALIAQLDASGNRQFEYSYLPGVDRPYAVVVNGGAARYYYQLDGLGNVVRLWATNSTVAATYSYDPFGFSQGTTGSFVQPLRWKGREYDSETGLYFMRARYYDPVIGRFISEDPLGVEAGLNPYVFADGDPVNRSDPSGLCDVDEAEWMRIQRSDLDDDMWLVEQLCWDPDRGWGGDLT